MSKIMARNFVGIAVSLREKEYELKEEFESKYGEDLEECLLNEPAPPSVTVMDGERFYIGIQPLLPWEKGADSIPATEDDAKNLIASYLAKYVGNKTVEEMKADICCIDDSWIELW